MLLSRVQLFVTPWTAAHQASLSITNSQSLLKLTSIESVMPSSHLILCHPLFLLHSIFPRTRVFSNKSVLHIRWPKYWSFSISSSNEHSGLISFRMDLLDLLAVQAMATHSSTLAWKILWTEEPGRLQVHGVATSRARLSDLTFTFHFHALEKEMATHSSIRAWRIPGTEEPSGLPSMGLHRVGHD